MQAEEASFSFFHPPVELKLDKKKVPLEDIVCRKNAEVRQLAKISYRYSADTDFCISILYFMTNDY